MTALIEGDSVSSSRRTVADLGPYWGDQGAFQGMDPSTPLYETQAFMPVADGTEGGVLWGNTTLYPGRVGEEFFMTRGHWHLKPSHGELCVTVSGVGAIVLMDREGRTWMEEMSAGSTHWISGEHAHRTVNVGAEPLVFLCAWPADCGHDYASILDSGFGARVVDRGNGAELVGIDD